MIDLLAPLDPSQTRLVSSIGQPFLQHQRLPVWDHIESELDREQLDAREVLTTLPEIANTRAGMRYGLVWYDRNSLVPNTPPCLTMAGMYHLGNNTREAINIGDNFIRVPEHKGVSALTQLGIDYPITDWQSAWAIVQRRTIDAFNGLREEIQEFHEIEAG